jgi:methenyltetrahydromethanopterin cyclohydrolase
MISVNYRANIIVQEMLADSEALGLAVSKLANGAVVIDAGVKVPGSLAAGRLLAQVCLGGLSQISFTRLAYDNPGAGSPASFWLPALSVSVDHPHIACMAAQYAGWAIKRDKFFAMGSGPARALFAGEKLFDKLDYKDQAEVAVLVLEGRKLPNEEVAAFVAEKCRVEPSQLTLLIAPTACLAGSVQIAARIVETGLHKLVELGFDIRQVVSGYGVCPLATVAADDLHAIGRTNDAVLYGGQAYYTVRAADAELAALVEKVPSSASRDYGTLFYDLFQRYGGDFYQIDPMLFSPAQVSINNLTSGRTYSAGQVNADLLRASLLEG